ncbi:hypothetical protein [Mangrovibacterium sp.]|uniref:hypothetical protein n=1 Tax=Mangrovibacterium sp. TaxID=1961364 RepID=UPI0035695CD7
MVKLLTTEMKKGCATLTFTWAEGDVIEYSLPVEVRKVKENELVEADQVLVVMERCPIVY